MDAHHYAGDLLGAFRLEHLEALMPAHNIPRDLVPDDGIHIPEIVQGAPDFLVSRVARLQILAGIIFCRFQHENGHFLNVYFRLYRWQKAHKINPFERPGAIFLRSEKTLYFCEIFHGRAPPVPENTLPEIRSPLGPQSRPRPRTFPKQSAKADCTPGLLHGEVRKPTTPLDFAAAKCESRPACPEFRTAKRESRPGRRTFLRRSAKADPGGRLCPGFWPRDRPRRRRKRFASLYRAEKPVFTKRRRSGDGKSYLVRPFVACFLAPGERN